MTNIIFSLITAFLVTHCNPIQTKDIFVSPDGDDNNKGTIEHPFLTLERAKTEVRRHKQEIDSPINVFLREGIYRLKETLVFRVEDSGTETFPVTYQAYQDEVTVFTSAVKIEGWGKAVNLPGNFPVKTRNKIWVAEIPNGFDIPKYLFQKNLVIG